MLLDVEASVIPACEGVRTLSLGGTCIIWLSAVQQKGMSTHLLVSGEDIYQLALVLSVF